MWLGASALIQRLRRREDRERRGDGLFSLEGQQRPSVRIVPRRGRRRSHNAPEAAAAPDKSLPFLYSLARSWAWDAVAHRCHAHPKEASCQHTDHTGDTVLHWTAFGRAPVETVRALLDANPELATVRNHAGMLPLHTACSYRASPAVVQAILAAYPEAAAFRDDRGGATPLHTACEHGCSVETLRVLLQHSEHGITALSLRDKTYRRKPLQMLNGRKNMHEEQRNLQTLRQARTRQRAIRQTQGQENGQLQRRNDRDELVRLDEVVNGLKQTEFWQKASILMVVEHQQQPLQPDQEIGDGSMILHAAIAIEDCPASLREYAVLLYEDLLLVPADQETGRLPLHLAAATLRFGRRSNEMSALILDLVVASPAASTIRDRSGRLPLTIALQEIRRQNSSDHRVIGHHAQREWWSVVSDGLQALIEANPLALLEQQEEEDVGVLSNSKRHPYVLSRLSPNSVFELIRAHPSMVLPLEEGADETIYSRR